MLADDQDILHLFDEFYLIQETVPVQPVKEKEILKEIPKEIPAPFQFLGANKKQVLWVSDQLMPDGLKMIENLVTKALAWSMDDIALIDLSQNKDPDFQSIRAFFNPAHIIFWGCDDFLKANKIPQKLYEVLNGKEIKVLVVQPVSDYENQPELKKRLWTSIQQLFELV